MNYKIGNQTIYTQKVRYVEYEVQTPIGPKVVKVHKSFIHCYGEKIAVQFTTWAEYRKLWVDSIENLTVLAYHEVRKRFIARISYRVKDYH